MNQKGFSLIELMMVIIIMGVASTIVISGYSKNRSSKALYLGAKQIATDIRMAQNYTFGALESGGENPSGGYGIRFSKDSGSYIIFGDKDSDKFRNNDGSEDFQTITLPEGITVQNLKVAGVDTDPVNIVFTSPYGKTYIENVNKDAGDNFIDLEIEIGNSTNTKTVTISSSRRIN